MGKQFEQTKLMQLDDKFLIEDQVLKDSVSKSNWKI